MISNSFCFLHVEKLGAFSSQRINSREPALHAKLSFSFRPGPKTPIKVNGDNYVHKAKGK